MSKVWNVNQWGIGDPRDSVPIEDAPLLTTEQAAGAEGQALTQGKTMIPYVPGSYCVKTLFGFECFDGEGDGFVIPQTEVYIAATGSLDNIGTGTETSTFTQTGGCSMLTDEGNLQALESGVDLLDGATVARSIVNFYGDEVVEFGNPSKLRVQDKLRVKVKNVSPTGGGTRYLYSRAASGGNFSNFIRVISTGAVEVVVTQSGNLTNNYKLYRTTSAVGTGADIEFLFDTTLSGDILRIYFDGAQQTVDYVKDDAITSLFNTSGNSRISTLDGTNAPFLGSCSGIEIYSDGDLVLDAPLLTDFEDKSADPAPVTVVGNPYNVATEISEGNCCAAGYPPQTGPVENLIVKSYAPVNQTATVLNATEYTLSVIEGEAISAEHGTAKPGASITFTTTSTSLPLTFADAKYVNLELGNTATRWIPTDDVPETRDETTLTVQSPLTQAKGLVGASFNSEGTILETTGNDLKVDYASGNLTVSYRTAGGIESFQTPLALAAGDYSRFILDWDNDVFKLYIDGSKEAEVTAVAAFVLDDTDIKFGDNVAGTDKVDHVRGMVADSNEFPEEQLIKMSEGAQII